MCLVPAVMPADRRFTGEIRGCDEHERSGAAGLKAVIHAEGEDEARGGLRVAVQLERDLPDRLSVDGLQHVGRLRPRQRKALGGQHLWTHKCEANRSPSTKDGHPISVIFVSASRVPVASMSIPQRNARRRIAFRITEGAPKSGDDEAWQALKGEAEAGYRQAVGR